MVFSTNAADLPSLICLDIVVILIAARLMGALFRRIGQPAVVGEIITGILLGPSALGALPGNPTIHLFPPLARPTLNVLAQLGVVLFMFIVGLEVDLTLVRGRAKVAGTVSAVSVVLPFGLGAALAVTLFDSYRGPGHHLSLLSFALFIGASMSVTAFPVLARILVERRMMTTELGAFTLACAAIDDVTAWTVLAVVVAIVAAATLFQLPIMLLELAAFVAASFLFVRPLLRRLLTLGSDTPTPGVLATVLAGLLLSAWITDKIGVNLIFGAFLFGAAMPKQAAPGAVAAIVERIESVTLLLLLPLFFVVAGLSVNVRSIGLAGLGDLFLILAAAIGGKFFGAALAARLQGITTRRSMAVGALMNTRGLTELVILTVGLHLGVLNEQLFTLLVIMAVVTTVMAGPLFKHIYPDRLLAADIAESRRRSEGRAEYEIVVAVEGGADDEDLLQIASGIAGPEGEVLLVRFLPRNTSDGPYSGASGDLVRMAAAMEELQVIVDRHAGSHIRPLAQFSLDRDGDFLELVARSGVDAALYDAERWSADTATTLANELACDVLTWSRGQRGHDGTVAIVVERQSDAEAALEAGIRLALGSRGFSSVVLVPGTQGDAGRCRRIADRLAPLSLGAMSVVNPPATPPEGSLQPLVVRALRPHARPSIEDEPGTPLAQWEGPLLRVAGHDDPQRVGLDQRLARLSDLHSNLQDLSPAKSPHPSAAAAELSDGC